MCRWVLLNKVLGDVGCMGVISLCKQCEVHLIGWGTCASSWCGRLARQLVGAHGGAVRGIGGFAPGGMEDGRGGREGMCANYYQDCGWVSLPRLAGEVDLNKKKCNVGNAGRFLMLVYDVDEKPFRSRGVSFVCREGIDSVCQTKEDAGGWGPWVTEVIMDCVTRVENEISTWVVDQADERMPPFSLTVGRRN